MAENQVFDFLSLLFGDAGGGHIVVCRKSIGFCAEAFPVSDIASAARFVQEQAASTDVYVEAALQAQPPLRRGSSKGASYVRALTLDFDIKGPAHAQQALPQSPGDLDRLLEAASVPAPTITLHTGNGLLAIWFLQDPLCIVSEADRRQAEALSRGFQAKLRAVASEQFGWMLDNTSDLARCIRVPGTLNHKSSPARAVSLWGKPGDRLPNEKASSIATAQSAGAPAGLGSEGLRPPTAPREEADEAVAPADFHMIFGACAFVRFAVEQAARLPEPEWYALAGILARCHDGEKRFHEISAADPRYDPVECQAKFDHALSAAPPRTCRSIAEELNCRACRRCTFWATAR